MTLPLTICAICSTRFEARTSYGLCSSCISKDRLREWDRLQSAIKRTQRDNLPVTLTLVQLLSSLSDFRGCCAWCQEMPHHEIAMINPRAGLIWENIAPICRICSIHKRNGFETAQKRVEEYLLANTGSSEDDINLEYHYERDDDEPYVRPLTDG